MPANLPTKRRGRTTKARFDPESLRYLRREKRKRVATSDASLEALATAPHTGISCDSCGWQSFTGTRYKCSVCEDFDLCSPCYQRDIHDLHSFHQITKPGGGQPIYLSARCKSSHTPSESSTTASSATLNTPQYPTASEQETPFFYKSMSTAELKTFLTERGAESDDVLDNETLCRRAWETYCECMSFAELNTFLSDRSVCTVGCTDVNSRREKAKSAFEPPSLSQSPIRFRKDCMVVLTGLKQAEMNGKMANVISVIHSEGKALVKVEEFDKMFKIKLENLQQDGEIEELE